MVGRTACVDPPRAPARKLVNRASYPRDSRRRRLEAVLAWGALRASIGERPLPNGRPVGGANLDVLTCEGGHVCPETADEGASRSMEDQVARARLAIAVEDESLWIRTQPFVVSGIVIHEGDHRGALGRCIRTVRTGGAPILMALPAPEGGLLHVTPNRRFRVFPTLLQVRVRPTVDSRLIDVERTTAWTGDLRSATTTPPTVRAEEWDIRGRWGVWIASEVLASAGPHLMSIHRS